MNAPASPAPTTAPQTNGAAPAATPAPATPTGAIAPKGAPPVAAKGGVQAKPGTKPLTPAEERFLYKRQKPDGTVEDIDISDFKTKVKVDGQEHELSMRELTKLQQMERSSIKRFEQVRKAELEVEGARQKIRQAAQMLNDPGKLLTHLEERFGDQVYDLLAERLQKRVQYEKLPPAERARLDEIQKRERQFQTREQQLAERERQIQAEDNRRRAERGKAQAEQWRQEWPAEFERLGLPQSPKVIDFAIERTVSYLKRANASKAPMSIAQAQKLAAQDVREYLGGIIKETDPDSLRQIVGDDGISRFAEVRSSAIDAQPGRRLPETRTAPMTHENGRPMSLQDRIEAMRKR